MHKIARILLDVCAIGWIAFVIIAIVMVLNSCGGTYQCPSYASIECQNCDEID
jgi:hypothetical protein